MKYEVYYRKEGDPITSTSKMFVDGFNDEDARLVAKFILIKRGMSFPHIMTCKCIDYRSKHKRRQSGY